MTPLPALLPVVTAVPLAVNATLLLAEFSLARASGRPEPAGGRESTPLGVRITGVFRTHSANQGWEHGGLND